MNKNIVILVITLALSAFIGYSDLSQTDTPITVVMVFVVAFIIGLFVTKQTWLYGILIGIGVPITGLIALINQWQLVGTEHGQIVYWYVHGSDVLTSLLAILIGLAGVYMGNIARKMVSQKE